MALLYLGLYGQQSSGREQDRHSRAGNALLSLRRCDRKYKFEGPRSHQKEIDNLLARRRAFRRGVELDRTFGLDNYDIQARQYFAMMPSWDRIDKKAEDYYHVSPYAYCGGDPVNKVDLNGDDFYVLLAKNGGRGFGHMALLIQGKDKKWYYYSKEGHGRKSVKGDLSFDSFDDFQASDDRLKYGKDRYTNSYLVKTDETDIDAYGNTPDERAKAAAELEIDTEYNPVTANCANVVKSALLAVGRPDGTSGENLFKDSAPNTLFPQIVIQNETVNLFKRLWDSIKDFFSK